jgi:hypothetical protein
VTLVEFLEARLFEDEQKAWAAAEDQAEWRLHWVGGGYRQVNDPDGRVIVVPIGGSPSAEQAAHIAWHDPARILREVAAKRALMQEAAAVDRLLEIGAHERGHSPILIALAAVYSDHPDYLDQWAP